MAWFKCIAKQGGVNEIPLIVTCASAFAGRTITCTDGITVLTDTCPSSAPYEITFQLPNEGTWTVSGSVSGTTYTESILVQPYEVNLRNNVEITVDVYSAANDTVSYVGIDGQTHTITTDSSGYKRATITINPNGTAITFTSSVAKDPSNLSSAYSKTVTLTSSTTSVYIMPNGTVMYWWGYKDTTLQSISSANGWTVSNSSGMYEPTYNTNSIYMQGGSNRVSGVGRSAPSTAFKGIHHLIAKGTNGTTDGFSGVAATSGANKEIQYEGATVLISPSSNTNMTHQYYDYSAGVANVTAHSRKVGSPSMTVWAWWVEA